MIAVGRVALISYAPTSSTSYLVKEDGGTVLLESGSRILLENASAGFTPPPSLIIPRHQAVHRAAVR